MRTSLEEAGDEEEMKMSTEFDVVGCVGTEVVRSLDDSVVRGANSTSTITIKYLSDFKETSTLFDKEGTQVTPRVDNRFTFDDTIR